MLDMISNISAHSFIHTSQGGKASDSFAVRRTLTISNQRHAQQPSSEASRIDGGGQSLDDNVPIMLEGLVLPCVRPVIYKLPCFLLRAMIPAPI